MTAAFSPGDLVYARGREWAALPSPDEGILCLRPLSGSEADLQFLHPARERGRSPVFQVVVRPSAANSREERVTGRAMPEAGDVYCAVTWASSR